MLSVVVFDNGPLTGALLSPLTDLRGVFDVRTGALTTLERLALRARLDDLPKPDGLIVPEGLAAITREKRPPPNVLGVNDFMMLAEAVLMVNGACPLADTDPTGVELGEAVVDGATGAIVKAHIKREAAAIDRVLRGDVGGLKTRKMDTPVLTRPWHVRAFRDACLAADLALITRARADWQMHTSAGSSAGGVFASPSATLHPSVIIDTEGGAGAGLGGGPGSGAGASVVVIDDHTVVRPGAIIVGPAYIGPHSTVLERTLIKPGTAIGPHCKVAGEVAGTIFQGYSNKAHEGHLGDSYVGEWVNLGAGTSNSNLLNTYGEVVARPLGGGGVKVSRCQGVEGREKAVHLTPGHLGTLTPGSNERTGQQFLGAIIGDHVKTAICTRIMTGAVVGTGTMFAASGTLSGTVPPFSWITDAHPAGTKTFAMEKFLDIARTVMARRRVTPSQAYVDRLRMLV